MSPHHERAERVEVLGQPGLALGRGAAHGPTTNDPSLRRRAPPSRGGEAGGQVRGDERPGDAGRPSSSKTTAAAARPSPTPPSTSARREGEDPGLGQLGPAVGVDHPAARPRRARTRSRGNRPAHETAHAARPGPPRRRRARSPRAAYPLGRPRMRSAMMLRWICDVPAAMVREKPCTQVSTSSALPTGHRPRRPAVGNSSQDQPGRRRPGPCRARRCAGGAPRRPACRRSRRSPGTPVRAAWETLRRARAHRASSSAPRWPIRRRDLAVVPRPACAGPRRAARARAPSTGAPRPRRRCRARSRG